jgi:DNA mismatch repair ATPase MutL
LSHVLKIFINTLHSFCKEHSIQSFLLHITCPPSDVEVVLDETRSYSYIRQRTRLDQFFIYALRSTLDDNDIVGNLDIETMNHGDNFAPRSSSLRLVSSKKVSTSQKTSTMNDNLLEDTNYSPSSPFTAAFMEKESKIDLTQSTDGSESKVEKNTRDVADSVSVKTGSFAKNESSHFQESGRHYGNNGGMHWTRTRVKALESQIRSFANVDQDNGVGINISKGMLSNAEFIAQLENKFIIIKMEGILCVLDPHAADERIGLERLEKALLCKVSAGMKKENSTEKKILLSLSKKESISSEELMKYVPLQHPKVLHLSPSQIETIRNQNEIINDWKFSFIMNTNERELTLTGVPKVCNKVATSNDFIQFLQAIERRTSDVLLVQPGFVKRAIASYACRYAVMFGDVLTEEKCKQIISDLSKCDMSFICAHGRPSVVPLLDLDQDHVTQYDSRIVENEILHSQNNNEFAPLRSQQRITKRMKQNKNEPANH